MDKRLKKGLIILVAVLPIVFSIGYRYMKWQKKEEHRKMVEIIERNKDYVSEHTLKRSDEGWKKIADIVDQHNENELATNYDHYTSIDGLYGLGVKGSEYYLVDVKTKQETKLDNVTNAYVCFIKNEDDDEELNGLFIQRDGVWYLVDEKGEVVIELTGFEVTEQTKFAIRDRTLMVVE